MKILMVSPVPTDPSDAGNRARIVSVAQTLMQAEHELHFAYVPLESYDLPAMANRFGADRLHLLQWAPRSGLGSLLARIARKLGRMAKIDAAYTLGLDDWYDPRTSAKLSQLQAKHRFDAVLVEYVFMSKAFEAFEAPCLKVLDTHDCFGLRHRHYLEAGLKPQWFSTTMAAEELGFRRADFVLAIQASEAQKFTGRLSGTDTHVLQVGHLVDLAAPPPPSTREAAVFVGSSNPLNVAGARYFIEQVLPLVREAKPGFELLLAGSISGQIDATPGVVKLGFVPKLQDAFASAMVAINPMTAGTGLNIKLLDAMAAAMPIVTTRSGARGVEKLCGSAFTVVNDDDPAHFAQQIVSLIDDVQARQLLAAGARTAAVDWNIEQLGALFIALKEKPKIAAISPLPCSTNILDILK